jgi:hypothetical protein
VIRQCLPRQYATILTVQLCRSCDHLIRSSNLSASCQARLSQMYCPKSMATPTKNASFHRQREAPLTVGLRNAYVEKVVHAVPACRYTSGTHGPGPPPRPSTSYALRISQERRRRRGRQRQRRCWWFVRVPALALIAPRAANPYTPAISCLAASTPSLSPAPAA